MAVGVTGFDGRPGRVFRISAARADGARRAAVTAPLAFRNSRRPWPPKVDCSLIGISSLEWDYEFHHSPGGERERTRQVWRLRESRMHTGLGSHSRNPCVKKRVRDETSLRAVSAGGRGSPAPPTYACSR